MRITPVIRNLKKGLVTIFIRIHDGGTNPKYKSTGHKIKETNWNLNGKTEKNG